MAASGSFLPLNGIPGSVMCATNLYSCESFGFRGRRLVHARCLAEGLRGWKVEAALLHLGVVAAQAVRTQDRLNRFFDRDRLMR